MSLMVLTRAELEQCVSLNKEAIQQIAEAFAALARGEAIMPPVLRLDIVDYHGEVDVKTAYVKGFDSFAIKISPGFFDNPKLGLPSLSGMMVLLSAKTGQLEALLLDQGYLTDIRTAAAGAVAADCLARRNCRAVGVIGAGAQARLQLQALKLVRDYQYLYVWARNRQQAQAYAAAMERQLGVPVEIAADPETLVRQSDVVVTTTPAKAPLIQAEWLHPGIHITAMGADAESKNELDPQVLVRADRFVCDRRAQSLALGELHHAVATGVLAPDVAVTELGEITAGIKPGRLSDAEITVCDLTGTGVQDTVIALHAYHQAVARGYGTIVAA